ncbi:MAG: hypothetical protein ACOH14_07690 [Rhodoglobus sp.]
MSGITHNFVEAHSALGGFTMDPTSVSNTASGRARAVVTGLYETSEGLSRALPSVANYSDPKLSDEGIAEARATRQAALQSAVQERVEHLSIHLAEAVRTAEAAAAPHRPVLDSESVAQLTRTDQAWNNSIRPLLEAGKNWDEIVPILDVDGLLAVQRFAPTHEAGKRSRFEQDEVPGVLAGINRMSESRLVDVLPSEDGRKVLRELRDVTIIADAANNSMASLAGVTGERDVMSSTLFIKRATFAVGAQPGAAEPTP